jgi:hypothetical protein
MAITTGFPVLLQSAATDGLVHLLDADRALGGEIAQESRQPAQRVPVCRTQDDARFIVETELQNIPLTNPETVADLLGKNYLPFSLEYGGRHGDLLSGRSISGSPFKVTICPVAHCLVRRFPTPMPA